MSFKVGGKAYVLPEYLFQTPKIEERDVIAVSPSGKPGFVPKYRHSASSRASYTSELSYPTFAEAKKALVERYASDVEELTKKLRDAQSTLLDALAVTTSVTKERGL